MVTRTQTLTVTRDELGRFARANGHVERFQQEAQKGNIPRVRIGSALELMRSIITSAAKVLSNSDVAYRSNRQYQRLMRRDPDVRGPLLQRQYAVALLDWDIVPEDRTDSTQVDQAEELKRLIRHNMRRWTDFVRHLDEAPWYGPAAANIVYNRVDDGRMIAPTGWLPFHSDSLVFNDEGTLGILVGTKFKGETVTTTNGRGHLFDDTERKAVCLHVFMPSGADYEEGHDTRMIYAGQGIRDIVWYMWMLKQTTLQAWATYSQRYGLGMRILTYPEGNDGAADEMETIAKNALNDVTVLMPRMVDQPDAYSFELLEAKGAQGGNRVFVDLIEGYLAGQIKELLIGQTATTEATATGLGSDVGTRHAETFNRIIRYDAKTLADSLTHELAIPLHTMNFGATPYYPRFEFNLEDVDSERFMAGVKDFVEMGGSVAERQVRSRLGLDEPLADEAILSKSMIEDVGGFGGLFDQALGANDNGRPTGTTEEQS